MTLQTGELIIAANQATPFSFPAMYGFAKLFTGQFRTSIAVELLTVINQITVEAQGY